MLALLSAGYAIAGFGVLLTSLFYGEVRVFIATAAALAIYYFFVMDTVKLYKENEKK